MKIERYIAAHEAGRKNPKHAAQWPDTLSGYVYPVLGELAVQAIGQRWVMKAAEPIWTQPAASRRTATPQRSPGGSCASAPPMDTTRSGPIGLDDRNHFPGVLRLRPNRISPVASKNSGSSGGLKKPSRPTRISRSTHRNVARST